MEGRAPKKPEEVNLPLKKKIFHPWRFFLWEALLFSLVLVLGIVVAFRLKRLEEIEKVSLPSISLEEIFLYFILGTLFVLTLVSLKIFRKKKRMVLKTLFLLGVLFGGSTSVSLLFPRSFWFTDIFALGLMSALIVAWLKNPSVFLHDLLMVLAISGVAGTVGLGFSPQLVVVLLVVFSIYDFIAVYKTKHMIKMAKELTRMGVISGLIIPSKTGDFKKPLEIVRPGGEFLILGGGDMAFPLFLCASLVSEGILYSLIVAFFALIGLFLSFLIFIGQRTRRPIPALPPIALFSIIGFLISQLFDHIGLF